MDFSKLEGFIAIANTGKITTAAERLYINQSSLSKQMKQLEGELGLKLFKKTRNGVELTQAGWDFYAYANQAISSYRHALDHLRIYQREPTLPLRIGALPLIEDYGMSESLCSYLASHRSVHIDYLERNQETIVDCLRRLTVDIAFVTLDLLDKNLFATQELFEDEYVVACRKNHPMAHLRTISLRSLRSETFMLIEEQSDITRLFRMECAKAGFEPNTPLHLSRHRLLLHAVERNLGIAVVPRRLVAAMRSSDLACVPFDERLKIHMGFAWMSSEGLSPVAQEFVDFITGDVQGNAS